MEKEQSQTLLLPKRNDVFKHFFSKFYAESKKIWSIAAPIIFTSLCKYSTAAITQIFAGHMGTSELAAVSVQNSVVAGFAFGIMLGMGSALETLCGQAYGAGQLDMLGIYLQRSWIILNATALPLVFLYIFSAPILELIGQSPEVSTLAGRFSIWMIPELFACAIFFPIEKFLQAQSKVMALAWISAAVVIFHTIFSWLLISLLGWGLVGAAVVYNASCGLQAVTYLWYVFRACRESWSGFSWKAFLNLWSFLRLSLASAVMLCLDLWYFMALVLLTGYLKNSEIAVDAISISVIIRGWTVMIARGFNAAISVRVSNELGAGRPGVAKLSVVVTTTISLVISIFLAFALVLVKKQYPALFSSSKEVQQLVYELTPLLATSIVIDGVQPVLSGVAIGAGWQVVVAYVNMACYYIVGIPLALLFGYTLDMGVEGIWYGVLAGTSLQTVVLFWMIYKTNWNREVSMIGERIELWEEERDSID